MRPGKLSFDHPPLQSLTLQQLCLTFIFPTSLMYTHTHTVTTHIHTHAHTTLTYNSHTQYTHTQTHLTHIQYKHTHNTYTQHTHNIHNTHTHTHTHTYTHTANLSSRLHVSFNGSTITTCSEGRSLSSELFGVPSAGNSRLHVILTGYD